MTEGIKDFRLFSVMQKRRGHPGGSTDLLVSQVQTIEKIVEIPLVLSPVQSWFKRNFFLKGLKLETLQALELYKVFKRRLIVGFHNGVCA